MDAAAIVNECRLCPSAGGDELLNVFNHRLSLSHNIKDVVLASTGVEIQEDDLVSKKICQRCCNITLKMYQFRQDALKQDRKLKETLNRHLQDKGVKLQNTCITIKKGKRDTCPLVKTPMLEPDGPSTSKEVPKKKVQPSVADIFKKDPNPKFPKVHPSVADIYKQYPKLKLPKKCFESNMAPVVSFTMGDVERYIKNQNINMKKCNGARSRPYNQVARKKTAYPAKQKTVAPLKISKKIFENNEQPHTSSNNYVCTVLTKKKRGRKRKIPLTDNVESLQAKNKKVELVAQSPKSVTEPAVPSAEASTSEIQSRTTIPSAEGSAPESRTQLPPAEDTAPLLESRTPIPIVPEETPSPIDSNSKDSREGNSNIYETTSVSTSSKPEFIESLGLIPRVVTTKSQKLLVCKVCGSVHNNPIELKWHNRNHMICQFCKRHFKSLEAKENHVDNLCEIKRVMSSSGLSVPLEQVHLNLGVRKKYTDAFSTFDPIPGLVDPAPLEHVLLKPAPQVAADGIIVLSDDEESPATSSDPLSGISTPSAIESDVSKALGKIRPDLKIKNNMVLNGLPADLSDKDLIKNMIAVTRPATCDQRLQTDVPDSADIQINNSAGTCRLRNINEHFLTYKIPVEVTNGSFNVAYQITRNFNPKKNFDLWDDLPVIDVYKNVSDKSKSVSHQNESKVVSHPSINASVTTRLPQPPVAILNSHVESTAAGSFPTVTITPIPAILPSCSTTTPTTSIPLATAESASNNFTAVNTVTQTNEVVNPISTLTSAASILKGTLNKNSHLVINYVPVPRTHVNYTVNKNSDSLKSYPFPNSSEKTPASVPADVAQNSLHADISNGNRPMSSPIIARSANPYVSVSYRLSANTLVSGTSFTANTNTGAPPPTAHLPASTLGGHSNYTPPTFVTASTANTNTGVSPPIAHLPASTLGRNSKNNPTTFLTSSTANANTGAPPPTAHLPAPTLGGNSDYSPSTFLTSSTANTNTSVPLQTAHLLASVLGANSNPTPPTPDPVKFRVKHVWELQ